MLRDRQHLTRLADDFGVPEMDVLLLALNLAGIRTTMQPTRVRFQVAGSGDDRRFFMIVAANQPHSPFDIQGDTMFLAADPVLNVFSIENDDCVLSYLRCNRTVLTLNSNSRSHCVGCVFCHAALQDTSDPRLSEEAELEEHAQSLRRRLGGLENLTRITVCTGCFASEAKALAHLGSVRRIFGRNGFQGQLHFIGSEIMSPGAFDFIQQNLQPFILSASIDCFSKRGSALRPSKARMSLPDFHQMLSRAREHAVVANFTYVLGIDDYADMVDGFARFAPLITRFPLINVLQVHTPKAQPLRAHGAESLPFYLAARRELEQQFAETDFSPHLWEGYRSLWYTRFRGELIDGPRI